MLKFENILISGYYLGTIDEKTNTCSPHFYENH